MEVAKELEDRPVAPCELRSIPSLLAAAARRAPGAPALEAPDRSPLSYAGLEGHVSEIAAALRALGTRTEDRVALVLPNGPEMAAAFLGVASVAACAPLNPAYRTAELDFYLGDLDARALVTTASAEEARAAACARGIPVVELVPAADAEAGRFTLERVAGTGPADDPPPGPEDAALVLHTSGTTSRPKIVPLSHRNLCASAGNVARTLALRPDDRCLSVMPLFHIHGLVAAVLASLTAGASVACTPGFDARRFYEWLLELAPTWYTAVPTMHQAVLARAGEHANLIGERPLRLIRSSSAALPTQVLAGLEDAFGSPVLEAYGMTEAAHQMACNPLPPGERKPGSVGRAAGPEIAVLDELGLELPPGAVGEIAIRGENVFGGYETNPEANTASFTGGWFRTGDEGCLDEEGYLFLRGRIKEIINRGGEKISPREVDEVLLDHPAVAQGVTFAVPHASLGEDVAAAVVLRDGSPVTSAEIRAFVLERVAGFKAPRRILILDELPKGPTGKVQRIGLAERLGLAGAAGAAARPAYVAPRTERERAVAELWSALLDVDRVGVDDDFFALGGDSIAAAELMAEASGRGWTTGELPPASLLLAPTVGRFADLLEQGGFRVGESVVVPLRPEGAREPLFLVHTHEGHVLHYLPIVQAMDPDQPVYALQAHGVDGGVPRYERLEDMAEAYVEEIRAIQPQGPYWLGGHCMGGTIVYEMARQLTVSGDEVGLAVVVDPTPGPRTRAVRLSHRLAYFRGRLALHLSRRDLHRWAFRKLARRGNRHHPAGAEPERPRRSMPPELDGFLAAMGRMRDEYVPPPYAGPIVVFRSWYYEIPGRYWRRHAPNARAEALPPCRSREERIRLLGERMDGALTAQRAGALGQAPN